jgi:GDP-mannose 6-dehydrogenase
MRISVFGMGYVGTVSAGCLARDGHEVIGVDPVPAKVALINRDRSPIIERDINTVIEKACREGRLRATTDPTEAVLTTEMSILCVGTPSEPSGGADFRFVRRVCEEIGAAIARKRDFHLVVARSTMLPGSTQTVVIPTLEAASGKRAGEGFGVCYHPEFLREGSAVADYDDPPKTVFGATDERSARMLRSLYAHMNVPVRQIDIATAEMVKYVDNVWHALKVCFANEVGTLSHAMGIDGHDLMDVFCSDTKLNISPKYLKPGFAFGGSCLPKDVRAVMRQSRRLDLDLPLLNAILPSNELQVEQALTLIQAQGEKRLGFLGISFKAGTDDLRESPVVELIERLLGKGYDIRLYDRNVSVARLVGANRDYILNHIPHLSQILLEDIQAVLDHAGLLVVGNPDPAFADVPARLRADQTIIDLVRVCEAPPAGEQYRGLSW